MTATQRRIFVAHPRHESNEALNALHAEITAALRSAGVNAIVTLGRDHFETHFPVAGTWDAWIADVVGGINPVTRAPRFTHYVVPSNRVGRATAMIVERVLRTKRVLRWDGVTFHRVTSIRCVTPGDQKTGWEVA